MARDISLDVGTRAGGQLLQARLAVEKRVPDSQERELREGYPINRLVQGFA